MVHAVDICDSACHCLEYDSDKVIVNCKNYKDHKTEIDFENLEWPKNENRSIQAYFNNMSLLLLPKYVSQLITSFAIEMPKIN